MNKHSQFLIAAALSFPLVAMAQSSPTVKPAEQPRTELEKDQTTKVGEAPKYGGPGTDTGGSMSKNSTSSTKHMSKKGDTTANPTSTNGTAKPDTPTSASPSGAATTK